MHEVNLLAILLSAVGYMAVGFFWYSETGFGTAWMKEMGYTKKSFKKAQENMGPYFLLSFLSALVIGYVLSGFMIERAAFFNLDTLSAGVIAAFCGWVGFMMPVSLSQTIYSKDQNWTLFFIDAGYQLAAVLVMGAIIGYLG